jgi:c-di-GMP-binding flagellar brake protein YcgR
MRRGPEIDRIVRKYHRYLLDIRVVVISSGATLHGRTKNLAEGGMGATVAGEIPLNSIVEVQFQLPEHPDLVALRAEVRYRHGFQYGFFFISVGEREAQAIRNAVRGLPVEEIEAT